MSIECLNKAINLQFKTQTPTKRLILILLANYCDEKNSCFPSYAHIGKLAGLKDVKHIANIIKEFEHYDQAHNYIDNNFKKIKEGWNYNYYIKQQASEQKG